MGYKFKGALKKYKKKIVVVLVLWLVLTIILICPLALAVKDSFAAGNGWDSQSFFVTFGKNITNPIKALANCLSSDYIGAFFNGVKYFSLIYLVLMGVGIYKSAPKHEYQDIEHGSGDWSENGEQYKMLSPDKGILLAEKNYLPVDKRGNTNVLVVGGSGSRKICILCYT